MRKMSKKSAIKWGVIALVIVALGALAYKTFKPKDTTPNYLTATAEIGDIENNVMASGKVKALNTVEVGAQVSGEVTRLFVDVGDEVKKGDLIATISDPYGKVEHKMKAPHEGYVINVNDAPIIYQGDAIFHISTHLESES